MCLSAFIAIANELLDKCNLPGRVSRLEECNDGFFVGVYKGLLGDDLPGKVKKGTQEAHVGTTNVNPLMSLSPLEGLFISNTF